MCCATSRRATVIGGYSRNVSLTQSLSNLVDCMVSAVVLSPAIAMLISLCNFSCSNGCLANSKSSKVPVLAVCVLVCVHAGTVSVDCQDVSVCTCEHDSSY